MADPLRKQIAERIAEFSGEKLRVSATRKYWALKPTSGENIVAAVVSDSDRVQFIIPSQALRDRAKGGGIPTESVPNSTPMREQKLRFPGLSLGQLQIHETLFREIVAGAVQAVTVSKFKT